MNDDERFRAQQIALTGAVMAIITHLSKTDPQAAGQVQITTGNYIDSRFKEGSEEHRVALEFLRMTLFSGWERHP